MMESTKITQLNLIEPKKCIIEDLEILAFENEDELNYYTIWHEALAEKKKNNEFNSFKPPLNNGTTNPVPISQSSTSSNSTQPIPTTSKASSSNTKRSTGDRLSKDVANRLNKSSNNQSSSSSSSSSSKSSLANATNKTAALNQSLTANSNQQSRLNNAASTSAGSLLTQNNLNINNNQTLTYNHLLQGSTSLPNGLKIINPAIPKVLNNKYVTKYKLTKLYNKYRGRQERRNYVIEKQLQAKIEAEVNKSYLNTWTSYTALQALRLPDSNVNQLSAATTNGGKLFTHMTQQQSQVPIDYKGKKTKSPSKKAKLSLLHQQQQNNQKPPMHLVYIDTGNIITYSNKINPQQIIEYRKKPPIQPSSATSKRSSAASYDVYEIMEVLANTNKTNVTITRNAHRPNQSTSTNSNPSSIYSHSINANTPGIVSTQLHLQARSYLDLMGKFYSEEAQRLEEEGVKMMNEPSVDQMVAKYMRICS